MNIHTKMNDCIANVSIVGDIDMFSIGEFYNILDNSIGDYAGCDILVNMEEVGYVDSSGISALVNFAKKHKSNNNRNLKITKIRENVFHLMKLVHLDKMIISDDVKIIGNGL